MLPTIVASLDSRTLARRLGELARSEREAQVDFLLHLAEFDARRAWAELGYGSLWEYCIRVLHLREGAAGRRIGAMRVLRRLPRLEAPLRDGRLCLSTVIVLGPHLTEAGLDALVERAAFKTKAEVEVLAVEIAPRHAPRDGVRKVAAPHTAETSPVMSDELQPATEGANLALGVRSAGATPGDITAVAAPIPEAAPRASLQPAASRPTVQPVAADTYSIRVTVDASFKKDLDALKDMLSHSVPDGDLAAVLHEALRCALTTHGKRKGSVEPARQVERKPAAARSDPDRTPGAREHIPAEVRRAVWKRDGGRCAWTTADGRRCASKWKLELDHIHPAALGGPSTLENLRLACRVHNLLHAEETFGAGHMAQFRRLTAPPSEDAIAGES
jgi:5-methylcytosine-specific restriction endonuclease McrA